MKSRSNFLLSKWYMDCVSDDGDVLIGYVASLHWRGLSINYSSILHHQNDKPTEVRTSLQKLAIPQTTGSSLHWSSDSLGVDGTWQAISPPIKQTIFESNSGTIEWHCLQPLAKAEVRIGKQHCLKGLGYAEHILISIPPWQLPIDELRWGRFLSDSDHLIWIDWRGAHPITLVFHNGVQAEDAVVTDSEVIFNDGRLSLALEEKQVLRDGPLIKTALSMIPGIREIAPFRSLNLHECKWRSRGFLEAQEMPVSAGWAIHEVVRWPK